MSFLSDMVKDLREKRLWPVAAALIVALVAVPALLSSTGKSAVAPLGHSAVTAPPATAVPAVSVGSAPGHSRLTGRARDPFAQQKLPAAGTSATGATAAGASAAGTTAAGTTPAGTTAAGTTAAGTAGSTSTKTPAQGGSGGKSAPVTSTPTPSSSPTGLAYLLYAVDLRFGRSGQNARTYKNVSRLTPFPSARDPILVFLGIKSDGKTAEFLTSSRASTSGTGTCWPAHSNCEFLDLTAGQRAHFVVRKSDGSLDQYKLRLTSVKATSTKSANNARLSHARVSPAGQRIVARAARSSAPLAALGYSIDSGLLSGDSAAASGLDPLGQLMTGSTGVVLEPVAISSH